MTCRVLVCRVGDEPKVEEVEDLFNFCKHSLLAGGFVTERVLRLSRLFTVVLLCDEDAEMKELPFNRNVPDMTRPLPPASFIVDIGKDGKTPILPPWELGFHVIRGNFLITKHDGDGGYESLSDEDVRTMTDLLPVNQCKNCKLTAVCYKGALFCGAGCAAAWEMRS